MDGFEGGKGGSQCDDSTRSEVDKILRRRACLLAVEALSEKEWARERSARTRQARPVPCPLSLLLLFALSICGRDRPPPLRADESNFQSEVVKSNLEIAAVENWHANGPLRCA